MGPWSPSVYSAKLDTPNTARTNAGKNANLFEMNFRGAVPSPSLPESNARGGWDDSDINQHSQPQQDWPLQQRKRALSSPALWSVPAQPQPGGSYFDQHQYSHQPQQQQQQPQPQHAAHDGQSNHKHSSSLSSQHPDMHDSINAISSLANFNQNTNHSQARQDASQPAPAPPAPHGTRSKRQRKTAPDSAESQSPEQFTQRALKEEDDELEHDEGAPASGSPGLSGAPKDGMDAEAQRKDLLDRNRIAARKSREKRKREVQALEQSEQQAYVHVLLAHEAMANAFLSACSDPQLHVPKRVAPLAHRQPVGRAAATARPALEPQPLRPRRPAGRTPAPEPYAAPAPAAPRASAHHVRRGPRPPALTQLETERATRALFSHRPRT